MDLRQPPVESRDRSSDRSQRWLLLVILTLLVALVAGLLVVPSSTRKSGAAAERHREVAARLQAAGALDEAAALYADYLEESQAPDAQRARIAYSLGTNYMEIGQFDKALRWFYETEVLGAGELADELASKVVHCLERLGRHHAAQTALERRSRLDTDEVQRPESDPVVARVGQREIRRSEVLRSLDSLPPEIVDSFSTPAGQAELLEKFVADELLWHKARKLEYDRDPEVQRRHAELLKQLAVTRFVETEVLAQIEIDQADLLNYFAANRQRYQPREGEADAAEITLDEVRSQVERDYQMVKMQSAYRELIDSELAAQDVELFPERMGDG